MAIMHIIESAPGIGLVGKVKLSNKDTRAVFVMGDISGPSDMVLAANNLNNPPGVTRSVLKAISPFPFRIGFPLEEGANPHVIEASLPFTGIDGSQRNWVVAGRNTEDRVPGEQELETHRHFLHGLSDDPKLKPQSGVDLLEFARQKNSAYSGFTLEKITPDTFPTYQESLYELYGTAFSHYPYDVVKAIGSSCGENIFVIAIHNGKVIGVTGAEYLQIGSTMVAEIGDSAALPDTVGLGSVLKRYLLQKMVEEGAIPDLCFTDSRIAEDGGVIKANLRAGLKLNPDVILPLHTEIASARSPGDSHEIMSADESGEPVVVENMTMTYIDRLGIVDTIKTYGGIRV